MSRDIRRLINSVEPPQSFSEGAPAQSLQEGGTVVSLDKGRLAVRRKHKGIVFKSIMSRDGNEIIDKKLTTSELEYKRKFVDYRTFNHNFAKDLDTDETYLPWGNSEDLTSMRSAQGYLTPFKMICHKLIFRPPNLTDNTDNITFAIKKIDNGDNTEDSVCNYTYSTTFVDYTSITINTSDWSASPTVGAGDIVAITIDASHTGITTSSMEFFITSVWKTFIET
tara:strand:- start:2622 stop:3293 length:672 start_codon:yes stop_codon:yes gene_type:complete